jgi:uncharacterized membrane protein (UPF0127 family)
MPKIFILLLLFCFLIVLVLIVKQKQSHLITFKLEGKTYKLLIAQNEKEWTQGLMNVKCPCDFDGMLFIFPDKQIRSFWNQNTFIDLNVYWLDENKVVGKDYLPSILKTKEPLVITSPLPVNRVIEIIIKE